MTENKGRTECSVVAKQLKKREKNRRYYYRHREEIIKKQSIYAKERRKDIALTKEELLKMNRDKFGHFIVTNGNQQYKRKQRNGRHTSEHVLIWEAHHKKRVPKGCVIHHINENKKDNRIENLKAMTNSEHTKMHFAEYYKNRDVWNKGKICPDISKQLEGHTVTKKQINKQKIKLLSKNLNRNVRIWELRDNGLTPTQISKQLSLTIDKVNQGWRSISKIFNPSSGRLI